MKHELLVQAFGIAADVHAGQKWRDGESAFISHPMAVASLVAKFGGDEEQAAAALVHDAISDARAAQPELARHVSPETARLAHAFADPPNVSGEWRDVKKAYLEKVRGLDERALLVIGAEELHELTDLLQDLRQNPPKQVWTRYPTIPMNMAWSFKETLAILNAKLKDERARKLVAEMALRVRQLNEMVFESA